MSSIRGVKTVFTVRLPEMNAALMVNFQSAIAAVLGRGWFG